MRNAPLLAVAGGITAGVFFTPAQAQDGQTLAQEALARGDAERAITVLQDILEESPDDPDLLRRLAVALAAVGENDRALQTIDRALALAPIDNDIRLARARILLWSGRTQEARSQAEAVSADSPDYPELDDVLRAIANSEHQTRRSGLGFTASFSDVELNSGASFGWRTFAFDTFAQLDPKSTVAILIDHENRSQSDTRLSLRVDRQTGLGTVYLGGSVTPNPDFRESWSLSGGGSVSLSEQLELLFDLRHADYGDNSITALQPAVRFRLIPQMTLTAQMINLIESNGDYRVGASGRMDYAFGPRSNVYFGAATYPDTEAGIVRQVDAVFAGVALPIADNASVRLGGEHERRRDSYSRNAVSIGISWRLAS